MAKDIGVPYQSNVDLVNVGLIRHLKEQASTSRQQFTKRITETNGVVAYAERTTIRSLRTRRRQSHLMHDIVCCHVRYETVSL